MSTSVDIRWLGWSMSLKWADATERKMFNLLLVEKVGVFIDFGAGNKWQGKKKSSREKKNIPHGVVNVHASFNNTIVSICDPEGNVISWASAGTVGFKGSRKGTPFAATLVSQAAGNAA